MYEHQCSKPQTVELCLISPKGAYRWILGNLRISGRVGKKHLRLPSYWSLHQEFMPFPQERLEKQGWTWQHLIDRVTWETPMWLKCNTEVIKQETSNVCSSQPYQEEDLPNPQSLNITYRSVPGLLWAVQVTNPVAWVSMEKGENHHWQERVQKYISSFTALCHQTVLSGPCCSGTKFPISSSSSICFKLDEFSYLTFCLFLVRTVSSF